MSFTSIPFLIFFCIFFVCYWFLGHRGVRIQNIILLIGSYFFYAWADWRMLPVLVFASLLNYFLGIYIERSNDEKTKKGLIMIGLVQGIGGLFLYKYFDFFLASVVHLFSSMHIGLQVHALGWLAPLGISFFTFKTISYLLDVSKGKTEACKDWVEFLAYIAFFPTIMAGPIDKARAFIPQLNIKREFNYDLAAEGMRQILWGLFKKSVIADNCATVTNPIFDNYANLPASSLVVGAFLYTFQIYADFSGYSDIAIGIGNLLGLKVTRNFEYPLFSQNIAEFWRKWHISLTSWLTEYVFTPISIAFRDYGKWGLIMAIIINFVIIGAWHGANWTYVLFGLLHGCYYIPLILNGTMNKKNKIAFGKKLPTFKELINVFSVLVLATFAFILFRSNTIQDALGYYKCLFSKTMFIRPPSDLKTATLSFTFILIMLCFEWFGRNKEFALSQLYFKWPKFLRWSSYILIFISILVFRASEQQFIYFKF